MGNDYFKRNYLQYAAGSTVFYKFWGDSNMIYTEGVHHFAKDANSYWLIDTIGFVILPRLLKGYRDWFYVISLLVQEDCTAVITVSDGNNATHFTHNITWTDFPIVREPVNFFLCEGEDERYCLMLPSKY